MFSFLLKRGARRQPDNLTLSFDSKLVNTAVSKTLDDRAINLDGLSDPSRIKENISLCLNSGRAIGCSFPNVFPENLMKGDENLFVTTIAQFIQVYLRSRMKIMYDGDGTDIPIPPPRAREVNSPLSPKLRTKPEMRRLLEFYRQPIWPQGTGALLHGLPLKAAHPHQPLLL